MSEEIPFTSERNQILTLSLGMDNRIVVTMQLYPLAIANLVAAAEWAKQHPEVPFVDIILHGKPPRTLSISMDRTELLSIIADMDRIGQSITLQ